MALQGPPRRDARREHLRRSADGPPRSDRRGPKPSMLGAIFGGSAGRRCLDGPASPRSGDPRSPPRPPPRGPTSRSATEPRSPRRTRRCVYPRDPSTRRREALPSHARTRNPTCKTPGPRGRRSRGLTRRRASPNASRRGRGSPTRIDRVGPKIELTARDQPLLASPPPASQHARRQNRERDQNRTPVARAHPHSPAPHPHSPLRPRQLRTKRRRAPPSPSCTSPPAPSGRPARLRSLPPPRRMAWRATANRTAFRVTGRRR